MQPGAGAARVSGSGGQAGDLQARRLLAVHGHPAGQSKVGSALAERQRSMAGMVKKMLEFYANSEPGRFEKIEGIDTLRFIDYGKQLRLVYVPHCFSFSVDTEKDLEIVRERLMHEER